MLLKYKAWAGRGSVPVPACLARVIATLRTNERLLRQEMFEDSIAWSLSRRVLYHADGVPLDSVRLMADYANWSADARPLLLPFVALFQTGDADVIRVWSPTPG